jgi:predicted dehydrogenase
MSEDFGKLSRRHFLGALGLAGAGLSSPAITARGAGIGEGIREGVRVGCIGVGNQGKPLMLQNHLNVVAVCDVDRNRLELAKKEVETRTGRECQAEVDYRRLLDSKELDAVIVATPDHWHALQTIHAVQAGKHVYVEKPASLAVEEGRLMVEHARRAKRIVQVGSMQRSDSRFRLACELVRSGRIGKLLTVRVGLPGVNYDAGSVPDSDPPAELDYELWLGPAPYRPYNRNRVHYNFRFFWDYSGGQMTNWGAHHLDIAQWGLGMDEGGPVTVEGQGDPDPKGEYEVFSRAEIKYTYANGIQVFCDLGTGAKGGVTFEGDQGWIHVNRGKLESAPAGIVEEPLKDSEVHLYRSENHLDNWYECMKSGRLPICDIETGHRSATVCHLGNLAARLGRKLQWEPRREEILGDAEASKLLGKLYRAPWRLPKVS